MRVTSAIVAQGRRAVVFVLAFVSLLATAEPLFAQRATHRGWWWNANISGYTYPRRDLPSDTTGQSPGSLQSQVVLLGNTFGYKVNRRLFVLADVPIYLVDFCLRASDGSETCGRNTGPGDVGLSLGLSLENPTLNLYSVGTLRLPTGDENKGLGVGRTTFAWTNTVYRRIDGTTPFGGVTLANSLWQTNSLLRPFLIRELVVQVSGGVEQRLHRSVYLGGLLYAIVPEQSTAGSFSDNGGSVWLRFPLNRHLQLQAGYTRSARLDLDVLSYGLLVHFSSWTSRR